MLASEIVKHLQERIAESGDCVVSAAMITPNGPCYEVEDITLGSGAGVDDVNKNPGELVLRLRERPNP